MGTRRSNSGRQLVTERMPNSVRSAPMRDVVAPVRFVESSQLRARNVILQAAWAGFAIHVAQLIAFSLAGLRPLALFNILSLAAFAVMVWAARRGRLVLACAIGLIEVMVHQALCTHYLGWKAGFHAWIVATSPVPFLLPRRQFRWSVILFASMPIAYLTLLALYQGTGPRVDVPPGVIAAMGFANWAFGIGLLAAIGYWYARAADTAEQALAEEHARSERLLRSILPAPIVERLKRGAEATIADAVTPVTVLFADLSGFTPLSERMTPQAVVDLLNDIFSAFDDLVERRGLTKIKTIGDSYMVAAGAPEARADHVEAIAELALAMHEQVAARSTRAGVALSMRIGIHTGPVVAGVIGKKTLAYDLWGDTVNTAARMESHGVPGRIQVTEAVREALGDRFAFEDRGVLEVKGKGPMRTFFLVAARRVPAYAPPTEGAGAHFEEEYR